MAINIEGYNAVEIGRTVRFSKTIAESDVYGFAGITGDFSPNHINEEYMKTTRYGRRIVHGALAIGFMSTASSKILEGIPGPRVSYGYDRVRLIKPIFIGDTITVEYTIEGKVPEKYELLSKVTVTNQRGELCAVATHILRYV